MWTWGELRLIPDTPEAICSVVPALSAMGVEPLAGEFDGTVLKSGARSRLGSSIKTLLLDQAVVAGVGNIYADESLFRSGINPIRKAVTLSDKEWYDLARQITIVLSEAVELGGTVSDNYVDVNGAAGRYSPQVYGRVKERCVRCESPLTGSRLGGRSTVYCPKCQK
jgi:formamidopyrimidine-DNA glycosylase